MKQGIMAKLILLAMATFTIALIQAPSSAQEIPKSEKTSVSSSAASKKILIAQGKTEKKDTKNKIATEEKELKTYISDAQRWLITSGLHVALILILTAIALKSTSVFRNQLLKLFAKDREGTEAKKRADTASSVVRA